MTGDDKVQAPLRSARRDRAADESAHAAVDNGDDVVINVVSLAPGMDIVTEAREDDTLVHPAPPEATEVVARIATAEIGVIRSEEAANEEDYVIRKGLGGSALLFSFAGLSASFFVGWAFPIGIVGFITGILAVKRSEEDSVSGGWAIALGAVSVVYSAGWLFYGAQEAGWLG